jgi:hypothetical protein
MTVYRVSANATQTLNSADGDSVILAAGVSIIDPSVDAHTATENNFSTNFSGVEDLTGGDNRVLILGSSEGHAGVFLDLGSNVVTVGDGGYCYGANCGVEFYDGGHNSLVVREGGKVESDLFGAWFGGHPHDDPATLPDSGFDTVHNAGIIEGDRREGLRMVLGGNHVVNTGSIQADLRGEMAILIQSDTGDSTNTISNSGTISAGSGAASVIGGDAALVIKNTGAMIGDIDFGAGADRLSGAGTITGTVYGGGGNDLLVGGTGDVSFDGGAGADTMRAGTGVSTFLYTVASDSVTGGIDTIDGFDFAKDHIQVNGTDVAGFAALARPHDLAAGGAGLLEAAHGVIYLVIDANGVAGYQAGADYEIKLTHAADVPS